MAAPQMTGTARRVQQRKPARLRTRLLLPPSTLRHTQYGGKQTGASTLGTFPRAAMLVRASAALRRGLPRRLRFGSGGRRLSGGPGEGETAACFPLNRALLRFQGPEAVTFLQGLLTNDVTRLAAAGGAADAPRAIYAHALNVQGRCLYDVILYRIHENQQEEPHILLECDAGVLESLQKHLKLYRIRRKVNITPCLDLSLWAVIPKELSQEGACKLQQCASKAVVATPDPRVGVMGWRLITSKGTEPLEVVPGCQIGNVKDYHRHRYKQGVPEGIKDLPSGIALPLESNLTYMNGISFTKGCYIGQELTARTHHMGVIRKRLLPIQLSTPMPSESISEGAEIVLESGKPAGKYRAGVDELGMALLRLANINEPLHLKISGDSHVRVTASIPQWWPKPVNK
ncbi:putative transferase CAF17, mitochondrial [Lacerta agilis]|uniref:putative transferase CAF17, mitochondrial n=1 Tax=Lacerta agilis TaxID=80427 RepID=UPI00141A2307|nr:putative transferase CAF17, mitochondrial [Lacerta agilis]